MIRSKERIQVLGGPAEVGFPSIFVAAPSVVVQGYARHVDNDQVERRTHTGFRWTAKAGFVVCLGTYIKLSSNERQSAYLYEESSFRIGARLRALS